MPGLADAVHDVLGQPSSVRIGTVDSIEPPVVSAQGVPFEEVGFLDGYIPAVGDSVALLGQSSEAGTDPASWLALGKLVPPAAVPNPTPPQAGQVLFTFVAQTSSFIDVVFDQPFADVPAVVCTIGSNAGVSNGWIVRSGLTSATGFRCSVSTTGAAVNWTNLPVFWHAMERTQ